MKRIVRNSICLMTAICASHYSVYAQWDGVTKTANDDIVTLRTGKAPVAILLNGDPATIFAKDPTTIRVFIPSNSSGSKCINSYIVKYRDEKAGQLIANHCQGSKVFDVMPGEITQSPLPQATVSQNQIAQSPIENEEQATPVPIEAVDPINDLDNNPSVDSNSIDKPQNGIIDGDERRPSMVVRPIKWNDDQFNTLDSSLTWQAGGEREPFLLLAIPETDTFFWIGGCKNGRVTNYIQSASGNEDIGSKTPIFFGTDRQSPMRYSATITKSPFGGSNGPTIVLSLAVDDPLFDHMVSDTWLYVIKGLGDEQIRTRISLSGSAKAIRTFQNGCAAQSSTN